MDQNLTLTKIEEGMKAAIDQNFKQSFSCTIILQFLYAICHYN